LLGMKLRFLALVAFLALWPRDLPASTFIALDVETLAGRADAVLVVVPEEKRSLWEDGRIATYTRVRVDRVGAGQPGDSPIWVRTLGGEVGHIGQLVEGEASLLVGKPVLAFL